LDIAAGAYLTAQNGPHALTLKQFNRLDGVVSLNVVGPKTPAFYHQISTELSVTATQISSLPHRLRISSISISVFSSLVVSY
jgi:hypothetical protein